MRSVNCKISVLMGVYNCAKTLPEAIDSILAQTYTNWELIICDDGSCDNTLDVANEYQQKFPSKIIVIRNTKNIGLNATLNRCLERATGEYIARMDGDDICSPLRFETEVEVLENERDISIVSTDMEYFDETGTWGKISHPEYPQKIDFLYETPFCHAPCMVRKEAYDAVCGYSVENRLLRVEDYHLWFKMYSKGFKGKNIHTILYKMRDDRNAYSRRRFKYRINEAYVRTLAIKEFELPITSYIYVLRPLIVGLLPKSIYDVLHKKRLKMREK